MDEAEAPPKIKRRFFSIVPLARVQLRYFYYFVGLTFFSFLAVIFYFLSSMKSLIARLVLMDGLPIDVVADAQQTLERATYLSLGLCVVIGIAAYLIGVRMTRRLLGPKVPMLRLIDQLIAGTYGGNAKLRTGDDYQDVADRLNELSQVLATKKS